MGLGNNVRVRLRGINTVRRYRKGGSFALYRYHRASGRQLVGEPGSAEFIESYAAAERSVRERAQGTVSDLIRRFEGSPVCAPENMAENTRKEYRRKLKAVERKWGSAPIASFNDKEFRKDVLDWRDGIAKRAPRESDNLVSAMGRLGSWAFDRGEVDRNVLDDFPRVIPLRPNGHALASRARPGVSARRVSRNDDRIDPRPTHGSAPGRPAAPDLVRLRRRAHHAPPDQGQEGRFDQVHKGAQDDARRYRKEGRRHHDHAVGPPVEQAVLQRALARGLACRRHHNLHFHDLRGTAITMLGEAGCTPLEIAAITGHTFKHVSHILETTFRGRGASPTRPSSSWKSVCKATPNPLIDSDRKL